MAEDKQADGRPDGWISAMRADPQGTQERNQRSALKRALAAAAGMPFFKRLARPAAADQTGVGKYTSLNPKEASALLAKQTAEREERAKKMLRGDPKKKAAFMQASKERWRVFESGRAQAQSPAGQAQYRATAAQAMAEAGRQAAERANRERELRTALAAPPERRTRR